MSGGLSHISLAHVLFQLQLGCPFPTHRSLRGPSFNCALRASVTWAMGLTWESSGPGASQSAHARRERVTRWPTGSPQPREARAGGQTLAIISLCRQYWEARSLILQDPQETNLPSPHHKLALAFPPPPFHSAFLLLPSFTHLQVLAQILVWGEPNSDSFSRSKYYHLLDRGWSLDVQEVMDPWWRRSRLRTGQWEAAEGSKEAS